MTFVTSQTGPRFQRSERGAMWLIVDGYRFLKHRKSGPKVRWYCGTHGFIPPTLFEEDDAVTSSHVFENQFPNAAFVTSVRGARMLLLEGYAFYKQRESTNKNKVLTSRRRNAETYCYCSTDLSLSLTSKHLN
ncbi:jg8377 [Pararge aegeria aegeria]|uniref:Jg8377 protein n=1 Tax=Pararge aegeria aegeria TaxID=348720 RepID=A0A8S4SI17_9NEOP|nr:jg8377 [Pararge aegeria aegeria]